jgi:hypothetical protein
VALPEFDFAKADFDHCLDGLVERAIAKTVGLGADLYAIYD